MHGGGRGAHPDVSIRSLDVLVAGPKIPCGFCHPQPPRRLIRPLSVTTVVVAPDRGFSFSPGIINSRIAITSAALSEPGVGLLSLTSLSLTVSWPPLALPDHPPYTSTIPSTGTETHPSKATLDHTDLPTDPETKLNHVRPLWTRLRRTGVALLSVAIGLDLLTNHLL